MRLIRINKRSLPDTALYLVMEIESTIVPLLSTVLPKLPHSGYTYNESTSDAVASAPAERLVNSVLISKYCRKFLSTRSSFSN